MYDESAGDAPAPFPELFRGGLIQHDFLTFLQASFATVNPTTNFVPNWHLEAVGEYLEALRRAEIRRLIINMPPRALKSVCVTVAWPAWLLAKDPSARIMAASYSQALALRHALDTRLILNASWFRQAFPECRIVAGENQKHKFVTTARGFRFATSVGGTATGEGGDVLIVDDPLNPLQAFSRAARQHANLWFDQTFSTRLNDKRKGRIVIVMQRLHPEDLSGHLLAKGGWEHLVLPAVAERPQLLHFHAIDKSRVAEELLHPGREGETEIARARIDLGSFGFAAQYQQAPVSETEAMVLPHWLKRHDRVPETFTSVVQSWDTAIKSGEKNDASACVTLGEFEGCHYLLDVLVLRAEYPELKRTVIEQATRWDAERVLIEDKANGQSLLQDLRRETSLAAVGRQPQGSKLVRFAACSALIQAGKLSLPKAAPWLADFEAELFAFPHSAHDDQVDALTQYLQWIRQKSGQSARFRRL